MQKKIIYDLFGYSFIFILLEIIITSQVDTLEVFLRRNHFQTREVIAEHSALLFSYVFHECYYTIMKMLTSHYRALCLHFVVKEEDTTAAVILILALNYFVEGRDGSFRTPLHTAAGHGNITMVELVLPIKYFQIISNLALKNL